MGSKYAKIIVKGTSGPRFVFTLLCTSKKRESRWEICVQGGTDKNIHLLPNNIHKTVFKYNQMTDPNKKQKAFLTIELLSESRIGETC